MDAPLLTFLLNTGFVVLALLLAWAHLASRPTYLVGDHLLKNRDFHESLVVGALTSAACVLASHLGYRLEAVVRHQDFADPLQLAVAVSAFLSIAALVLGHRAYRVIARRADRRAAARWLRAMNDLDMA
ncbi:hypothetical protein [Arenimonas sp. MALMAid1274]|uniref:hypothetical protein n=1 Tax=Arenimonas sp. MALMAid1274 TaxID=3411630 RepID=UPI003B9FB039